DFTAASAATTVGSAVNTPYVWGASPAMVADVQAWLDNPSSNFGWLLLGDESTAGTARVFNTREAQSQGAWPSLVVTFKPPISTTPRLVVSAPSSVTAGSAFSITVTAVDSSGNIADGYSVTLSFTTSDSYHGVLHHSYNIS